MKIIAVCETCRHKHPIDFDPRVGPGGAFGDWLAKHPDPHLVNFLWPGRTAKMEPVLHNYKCFLDNADVKIAYASSASFTITLASLASDTNLLAGRESTAVANDSNNYLDYMIAGQIRTGTSPTDDRVIQIFGYGATDDTPTYPDVLDGTDSDETLTSDDIRNACLAVLHETSTNNTSDRDYWFRPVSLAGAFGGLVPTDFGLFVVHNTGVNLNSTGGNHNLEHTGVYATVT